MHLTETIVPYYVHTFSIYYTVPFFLSFPLSQDSLDFPFPFILLPTQHHRIRMVEDWRPPLRPLILPLYLILLPKSDLLKQAALLYWGAQNWTQHSRHGLPRAEQSVRPSPSTCWQWSSYCSPGCWQPSMQAHIAGSSSTWPPGLSGLFLQSCLSASQPSASTSAWSTLPTSETLISSHFMSLCPTLSSSVIRKH